ncbi:helix-turn-helix domain-containing protein [Wukongibacter sp. M2B1]|uniref:helix-turn-helix domain-containing protein n=1 Tax=Wukongibacter sp. M2B1 TaxID=3088895 RepID=UPI003D7AFD6B
MLLLTKSLRTLIFIGHTWTCALLALYINQTYGIKVSITTIWSILKKNNLSYKRAEPKPTKADEAEQEAFKKMLETIDTLEHSSDTAIYALDETSILMESNNRASWSEVGLLLFLRKMVLIKGLI